MRAQAIAAADEAASAMKAELKRFATLLTESSATEAARGAAHYAELAARTVEASVLHIVRDALAHPQHRGGSGALTIEAADGSIRTLPPLGPQASLSSTAIGGGYTLHWGSESSSESEWQASDSGSEGEGEDDEDSSGSEEASESGVEDDADAVGESGKREDHDESATARATTKDARMEPADDDDLLVEDEGVQAPPSRRRLVKGGA